MECCTNVISSKKDEMCAIHSKNPNVPYSGLNYVISMYNMLKNEREIYIQKKKKIEKRKNI
jgi:hypothetical protein